MILEALADTTTTDPEYRERLEWVGEYHPEVFNHREVRFISKEERLQEMFRAAEQRLKSREENKQETGEEEEAKEEKVEEEEKEEEQKEVVGQKRKSRE